MNIQLSVSDLPRQGIGNILPWQWRLKISALTYNTGHWLWKQKSNKESIHSAISFLLSKNTFRDFRQETGQFLSVVRIIAVILYELENNYSFSKLMQHSKQQQQQKIALSLFVVWLNNFWTVSLLSQECHNIEMSLHISLYWRLNT